MKKYRTCCVLAVAVAAVAPAVFTRTGPRPEGVGDGLNTVANYPFDDFTRVTWSSCYRYG